jgi:hypothetical protein
MSYLVLQKGAGGRSYAYRVTARWDSETRMAVQERVYLGRQDPKTGRIIAGRSRRDMEAHAAKGVTIAEAKRLIKSGGDLAARLAESAVASLAPRCPATVVSPVDQVTEPACLHLAWELARSTGLVKAMTAAFGKACSAQLTTLAAYQVAEGTPLYLARPWLERVLGGDELKKAEFIGDGGLLESVGADLSQRMRFFREWIAKRRQPTALVYDITSVSTYSGLLDIAEFGYNRDGESLPQINLASIHDRTDGLPLFYRVIPGSIGDTSTLKLTNNLMRDLGLKKFHFVLDRGFCSHANMADMIRGEVGFTMAVPLISKVAKAFVMARRPRLGRTKNAFIWKGEPMFHVRDEWQVELGDNRRPAACAAHLYLDSHRKSDEETRFLGRVLLIEERAARESFSRTAEAYAWLDKNALKLKGYFAVSRGADGAISVRRKNHAVARRCGLMGLTLIVTTDGALERDAVLAEYRSRDGIEKAFDILKNENGQNRLHISTREQAEGRLFLAFLAMVISCELDRRMRASGLYKRFTTAEVLAELAKIRALRMTNGAVRLLEISKTQRTIFEKLKVPPVTGNIVIK